MQDQQSALGKIYISVDDGSLDMSGSAALKAVAPNITGVYCTLYLGKQRAKTPTCTDLNNLGWTAFEFEFSIYEYCNKLAVSLFAKFGKGKSDQMLCTWSEETELLDEGNYERWVSLTEGNEERCRLRLHLRMEQLRRLDDVSIEDFDTLTAIGEGAFGKVMTVRKKSGIDTGKIYAMKVLEKGRVTSKRQLSRMLGERNILMKIRSPFIVGLHYAFETSEKAYLVLDFVGGGDLFHHLRLHKKFAEECVRFWSTEIILALEVLHEMAIVYRDLKPENILLEPDGHVVLVDFGLAKHMKGSSVEGVEGRSNSFVGTPEYLAPEVVQGTGHGFSVDWWTFGILIFELLIGKPPFKSKDLSVLYQKIVSEDAVLPNSLSLHARSLLRGLLSRNPDLRLGAKGGKAIREHVFFEKVDWAKQQEKTVPPPYQPLSPADYLTQVFSMVDGKEGKEGTGTGKLTEKLEKPEAAEKIVAATSEQVLPTPALPTDADISKLSAELVPDYMHRVVNLIEKWQLRIMAVEGGSTPGTPQQGPPDQSRHSTGSWKPSASAAVALEHSIGAHKTRVTAHKHKRTNSSPNVMKDLDPEDPLLTPLASPVPKPLNGASPMGRLKTPVKPMSPVPMLAAAVQGGLLQNSQNSPVPGVDAVERLASPLGDLKIDTGSPMGQPVPAEGEVARAGTPSMPSTPLHGLLFGHEVAALESIIREMQTTIEKQSGELRSYKVSLRDVTAERDVLKQQQGPTNSNSGDGEAMSNALAIAMEETESLVSLAHKMATAMSSSMGPANEEISEILGEAQKLMGLAREEKRQAEQAREGKSKVEEAKIQNDKQGEMANMSQQFAVTEETYIQAMVESQQSLATAAAERNALLQLASKLEEHSRLQAQREGDLVQSLAEKTRALDVALKEKQKLKAENHKDKGENVKLRGQIAELKVKLQQFNAFDAALEAYGEESTSEESGEEFEDDEDGEEGEEGEEDDEEGQLPGPTSEEEYDPAGEPETPEGKKGIKGWFRGLFGGLRNSDSNSLDEEQGRGEERRESADGMFDGATAEAGYKEVVTPRGPPEKEKAAASKQGRKQRKSVDGKKKKGEAADPKAGIGNGSAIAAMDPLDAKFEAQYTSGKPDGTGKAAKKPKTKGTRRSSKGQGGKQDAAS